MDSVSEWLSTPRKRLEDAKTLDTKLEHHARWVVRRHEVMERSLSEEPSPLTEEHDYMKSPVFQDDDEETVEGSELSLEEEQDDEEPPVPPASPSIYRKEDVFPPAPPPHKALESMQTEQRDAADEVRRTLAELDAWRSETSTASESDGDASPVKAAAPKWEVEAVAENLHNDVAEMDLAISRLDDWRRHQQDHARSLQQPTEDAVAEEEEEDELARVVDEKIAAAAGARERVQQLLTAARAAPERPYTPVIDQKPEITRDFVAEADSEIAQLEAKVAAMRRSYDLPEEEEEESFLAPLVVVMGPCGCGKTSVGRAVAAAVGVPFVDADSLHPPANTAKMEAGTPLTDEDRTPWLAACAAEIAKRTNVGCILACSALKREYRAALQPADRKLWLVFLDAPESVVLDRVVARQQEHFMPPSLVASQYSILQRPAGDEAPEMRQLVIVDATQNVDVIVAKLSNLLLTNNLC